MYEAIIKTDMGHTCAVLGPTDSRDEASRLARAWVEASAHRTRNGQPDAPRVGDVEIRPAAEEEDD